MVKIVPSKSGDPSNSVSQNKETSAISSEKVLEQLMSINQNTLDNVANLEKTNQNLNNLTKAIDALVTNTTTQASQVTSQQSTSKKGDLEAAQVAKINAQTEAIKTKEEEESAIRSARLQQIQATLERNKILQERQDSDYAEMKSRQAAQRNKMEAQAAASYNPIANTFNGIKNAQPGTLTQMLTMGLTGGLGNMVGLDKVLSAGMGFVGKKVSGLIGKPFQAMAQRKEEQKAEERAINDAIKAAELNKKIEDTLRSKGLLAPKSDGKPEEQNEPNNTLTNPLASKNKKNNTNSGNGEEDDRTTASVEENWEEVLSEHIEKIDENIDGIYSILDPSREKDKDEEEEEEGGILDMLSSMGSSLLGGLKSLGSMALSLGGPAYMGYQAFQAIKDFKEGDMVDGVGHALKAGVSGLGGAIGYALGGKVGAQLGSMAGAMIAEAAQKAGEAAANWLDKHTNLTGSKNAQASMNVAAGVSAKENRDAAQYAGGMMGFELLNSQYEQNKEELEKGMLWGKSSSKVNQWRQARANSARDALTYAGYGHIVKEIDDAVKSKKMTNEEGQEELIKRAKEITEQIKKQNEGRSLEEMTAENDARRESAKVAKEAEKQTIKANTENTGVMETKDHVIYGDLDKRNAEINKKTAPFKKDNQKLEAEIASGTHTLGGVATRREIINKNNAEIDKIENPVGQLNTFVENDEMFAVEINKDLLTESGQLSEEGILILKKQGVSDQQLQSIQNIVNSSTQNNGSNVYQTNITQQSDAAVYATGDAARTMNMN